MAKQKRNAPVDPANPDSGQAAARKPVLKKPRFAFEDLEARHQWLWKLAYNAFEQRVTSAGRPADTRFVLHLSELLGLGPAANDNGKGRSGLGAFLDAMTPEEFAEYKQQDQPG
ncbi:hypothetical protein [Geminicoccus flavidas]|uniref:hypothetical protein n=1 Tax=Geminicoccus flavidas TaxID=2506407 RepID=UPI00135B867C|nr:hypothetical protein [Geminicoccus flavidas]